MEKKASVIILNYNGWKDTVFCLETLGRLQITNYKLQIIIVDNASEDKSVKKIKKWISSLENFPPVELVELRKNLGFSGGSNIGIRFALEDKSDYILLLNNDTLVDSEFLKRLVKTANSDKEIGIVAPKIYFARGYEFYAERYKENEKGRVFWYAGGEIDWKNMYAEHRGVDEVDKGQYNRRQETDFASGCCMLIKREVIENIGFLDEQLYLYLEDVDFCLRARQAGYKIVYEPRAVIWHKNASSSGKPGSKLHQYYQTRNKLIVGIRYASFRTKLALLRESLGFFRDGGVKREAVLDFYLYKWGRKGL